LLESPITKIVRSLNPIAYVLIGVGILIYVMRYDFTNYFPLSESGVFITSIASIGYGAAILLLNYLRGNRLESKDDSYLRDELRVLRNEIMHGRYESNDLKQFELKIKEVEALVKNSKKGDGPLSDTEKKSIITEIRENILSDASSSLLAEIEEKYSNEFSLKSQVNGIQEQLENTRLRLRREVEALGRRGNVNLVIGVLTTVAAVGILTTTILDPTVKLTNDTLVTHFAPRLTLSLFIEIFSFFFLKLYKSGLGEIKYFQNELTNIELKFVSLESALRSSNEDMVMQVVSEFSKTERNFVLEKGQSTVELERTRMDSESSNNMLSSMSKLVESIKK
jgi:hypothetical protein